MDENDTISNSTIATPEALTTVAPLTEVRVLLEHV